MTPPTSQSAGTRDRRHMTKRDWQALYIATQLADAICLRGAVALDEFAEALRATPPAAAPTESET